MLYMNFKNIINKGWPVKQNTKQTFICSKFKAETQEKSVKMIKVNNTDTRRMSFCLRPDVIFHTFDFKQINGYWVVVQVTLLVQS